MNAANSPGCIGSASPPTLRSAVATSADVKICRTSAARRSTIARGVPAGANNPCQPVASKPGTVSATAPQLQWQGNATGYGVMPTNLLLTGAGQNPICPPAETGTCDRFTLTVADKADLVGKSIHYAVSAGIDDLNGTKLADN